jgi:hypothetical protein
MIFSLESFNHRQNIASKYLHIVTLNEHLVCLLKKYIYNNYCFSLTLIFTLILSSAVIFSHRYWADNLLPHYVFLWQPSAQSISSLAVLRLPVVIAITKKLWNLLLFVDHQQQPGNRICKYLLRPELTIL